MRRRVARSRLIVDTFMSASRRLATKPPMTSDVTQAIFSRANLSQAFRFRTLFSCQCRLLVSDSHFAFGKLRLPGRLDLYPSCCPLAACRSHARSPEAAPGRHTGTRFTLGEVQARPFPPGRVAPPAERGKSVVEDGIDHGEGWRRRFRVRMKDTKESTNKGA